MSGKYRLLLFVMPVPLILAFGGVTSVDFDHFTTVFRISSDVVLRLFPSLIADTLEEVWRSPVEAPPRLVVFVVMNLNCTDHLIHPSNERIHRMGIDHEQTDWL